MNTVILNRKTLTFATGVAAVLAALATVPTSAFAQEATYELPQAVVVHKSRADVHAEVVSARAAGTLVATEADFQKLPAFASTRSRALVAAEARADATAAHALVAEPHGFDAPRSTSRSVATGLMVSAAR